MQRFLEHVERLRTEVLLDHIHTVYLKEKSIRLVGNSGEYTCDVPIVPTGAPA